MAKKGRARKGTVSRRLRSCASSSARTNAPLAKAQAKGDRRQARVEALSIIADEIRAQLAEAEQEGDHAQGSPRP